MKTFVKIGMLTAMVRRAQPINDAAFFAVCFVFLVFAWSFMPATAAAHHQDRGIDSDSDGTQNFDDPCSYAPTPAGNACNGFENLDGDPFNKFQDPCDDNPSNWLCDSDGDGQPNQFDPCPSVASGHMLGSDEPLQRQTRECPSLSEGGLAPGSGSPPGSSSDGTTFEDPIFALPPNSVVPEVLSAPFPVLESSGQADGRALKILSDPGIAVVAVSIDAAFRARRNGTRIRTLLLRNIGGYTIEMRCKGRGCPFRRDVALPSTKSAFNAKARFKGARLGHGAVIQIRVVRGELFGKWYRFRLGQSHRLRIDPSQGRAKRVIRRLATVRAGCLAPSSVKRVKCPRLANTPTSTNARSLEPAARTASHPNLAGALTPDSAVENARLPEPYAGIASHTKAIATVDDCCGTWYAPGGKRIRVYLTEDSVRRIAQLIGNSNAGAWLAQTTCTIVLAAISRNTPIALIGCSAAVLIYRETVAAWFKYVARHNNCLVFYFYPGVNNRSRKASGAWVLVGNPAQLNGWMKFDIGTVPNAGPGGNCREH